MKKLLILLLVVLSACHSKPKTPFTILRSVKAANGITTIDVQVNNRVSKQEMVAIAAYIKSDSSQYKNLQINYLLPGNSYKNTGGITIYATAAYHNIMAAADTVKDTDNNLLSFEFVGFTPEKAKQLLAFKPDSMPGKRIMGKFIDDNTKTISIIYEDKRDDDQIHILELDTLGKVVSAIVPMEVTYKGVQKLVVSQKGDYLVLKDSVLTMYSSDDFEKPYRSIKEGL